MTELHRQGEIETRFAQRILAIRKALGLSAQGLADRMAAQGHPELNRRVINKIETGERGIGLDEAVVLCAAFDVGIADMVSAEPVRFKVQAEVTI